MFIDHQSYIVDSKSRLVKQIPINAISEKDEMAIRDTARHAAEAVLGKMPIVNMSLSGNESDPLSMVRVEKYEFIVSTEENGKSLMIRYRAVDAYDKEETSEFLTIVKAVENAINRLSYQQR